MALLFKYVPSRNHKLCDSLDVSLQTEGVDFTTNYLRRCGLLFSIIQGTEKETHLCVHRFTMCQ